MAQILRDSGFSSLPLRPQTPPAVQQGIHSSRAPFGAEHDGGAHPACPALDPSCAMLGRLQCCPEQTPRSSARARHFAQRNVQFSALLRLAAGMQTPSIQCSLVSQDNLCTPQLFSCITAICIPAPGFRAICTSPRNHRAAAVLALLVLGTAGPVERDNHKALVKRKSSQTKPGPFPVGLLVHLGCWERLPGPGIPVHYQFPALPNGSDGVGGVGRSCRPAAQIQIPAIIGVPGCPLAPCPPAALGRLRASSGALMALRNATQGSWEPLSTLPCTSGMGSAPSEGRIKPQLFHDPLIHPGACPCQQTLWLSLH